MSTVSIAKGKRRYDGVNLKVYNNYYKNAGWLIVNSAINHSGDEEDAEEWDKLLEEEGGEEKPLSELNREELEAKAREMGVSLDGLTTVKQFREAIKAAM